MPNESRGNPPTEIVRRGHEPSDASPKGIALFALCLVLGAVVIHVALYFYFAAKANVLPVPRPVLAAKQSDIARHRDLVSFQQQEQATLNSYQWIDRERGTVRIPIKRAMELLAERGLPVRKGPSERERSPLQLQQEKAREK